VRIPLDYYRILGLPTQATAEQVLQAHRDRTQQLPRREFSEAAISSRNQLLDDAYAILADSEQRQSYDASLMTKSYDLMEIGRAAEVEGHATYGAELGLEADAASIEIPELQFVGALLILLDLGEYELVLRLGRPYLSGGNLSLRSGEFGDPDIVLADIVLTVALACLELGREQWQQGQYENAAESLETGQQLLLRESLFASLRGEMQADLYKLRPYRVLELFAMPGGRDEVRRQGLGLLEDMLHDRGGIDGNGDDQSGLSVDDFLRFIQQLRGYLTVAEQQTLFEAESRRPSAVAAYLAVYALIARGFAERQPSLVRKAKLLLLRLGTKQDVHLEQAVCALLLGQTEEASRALELSQEFESLAFIRDHSQGSPDQLPGLCLYSERWLQNEVFPHFRDLSRKQPSLKEYFADEGVQAYLEELPNEPETVPAWSGSPFAAPRSRTARQDVTPPIVPTAEPRSRRLGMTPPVSAAPTSQPSYSNGTGTNDPPVDRSSDANGFNPDPIRQWDASGSWDAGEQDNLAQRDNLTSDDPLVVPAEPTNRRGRVRLDRLLLLAAAGIVGITLLGLLATKLFGGGNRTQPAIAATPAEEGFYALTQVGKPSIPSSGTLTKADAKAIVEAWLTAKESAMGEKHDTAALDAILAEPILSQWKGDADQVKAANSYLTYEHSNLEITSVETNGSADVSGSTPSPDASSPSPDATPSPDASSPSPDATAASPTQATIEATVTEKIQSFTGGKPDKLDVNPDNLRVRYSLIRQDQGWRIESIESF
jgi:ARC6-like, IMS domain/DnaJ domain